MPRVLLAAVVAWFGVTTGHVNADPPTHGCQTVVACRAQLAQARQAINWQRDVRRRLEARLARRMRTVNRPTVLEAANVASLVYGVPASDMLAVSECETGGTFDPRSVNPSSGATGAWQFLASTWQHTRYRMFPRTDPWVQALATAEIVRNDGGWHQWACKP